MDREVIGAIGVGVMILLMFLRVPVAMALLLVGWGGVTVLRGDRAADAVFSADTFGAVLNFDLTTIPSFMLMGYITYVAGFTRDIYDAARIWFGRISGGLAAASTMGCAAFAAVSGSSLATAAAMGKIAVPEMLRRGYDKGLATGVVAASGTLGSLIPPSVLMILYAVFTEQSIALLFMAGIIPGILSAGIYIGMVLIRARINPKLAPGMAEKTTWGEKFRALKGGWGIALLFILVMGGILIGVFTPMEAGAIGASGAFLISLFSGRLTTERLKSAFADTLRHTGSIFAIVFGAMIFARFMALSGLGQWMADMAGSVSDHVIPVIIALSIIYIILGTFMGSIEIMLITLPIVTPIVESYDVSLIWFGVIMIKYLEIGLITPPLGFNVFMISSVVGRAVPIQSIFRGVMWFLAMDVLTLGVLIAWPQITLWLPDVYAEWMSFLRNAQLGSFQAIWLWMTGGLNGAAG
ncbi:TRAP transporter large permease [Pseudooceanicola sp.]|uniref:TRAP transporter large permease n=1 Tax=Pseudooceanicola sp. TaxID=1914328 RepID=UPI0026107417|nr:TRAP transporter large permease [Pseudooceanicola sp.]MDF1857195.1 TRAP transporter large permease [Pseudooceanicola sp.]